jgi:hypothetical protein
MPCACDARVDELGAGSFGGCTIPNRLGNG